MSIESPVDQRSRGRTNRSSGLSAMPVDRSFSNASATNGSHTVGKQSKKSLKRRFIDAVATPWRMYETLRQSMTVASVMAMLCLLLTLNVIWGFPWSGMMGACVAMLSAGFLMNRFMRPKLRLSLSLPRSSVVGEAFAVNVRLQNERAMPALGLRIGWQREGTREVFADRSIGPWEASSPVSVEVLRGNDTMHWHGQMRFDKRGVHELPPFQVTSSFPFHLFYARRAISTNTKIAVTPAPLRSDHDAASRVLLATIGEWAKKLVVGPPVEYVGNREYEVGMPVRRWDFASWARLGRPIVREYQAPSIQAVTLIVDTSVLPQSNRSHSRGETRKRGQLESATFERLMSAAATAVAELLHRRIQLKMMITGEPIDDDCIAPSHGASDSKEAFLVRLAGAESVPITEGNRILRETLESKQTQPLLILSRLPVDSHTRAELTEQLPNNVTYIPIPLEVFLAHDR